MDLISVLVADDHPIVSDALRAHATDQRLNVVAEVNDPAHLSKALEEHSPDVVVLDLSFGPNRPHGLSLIKVILAAQPHAKVVVYSQHEQVEAITEAYRAGAMCYLTKRSSPHELAVAIRRVVETGKRYFPEGVAERMADAQASGTRSPREALDERALRVFELMARGRTQEEIAREMDLSVRTVATTMGAIKERLGVSRPAEITLLALQHQIIDL